MTLKSDELVKVILFGDKKFHNGSNFKVLRATIKIIKSTQHLEQALYWTTVFLLSLYVRIYLPKYFGLRRSNKELFSCSHIFKNLKFLLFVACGSLVFQMYNIEKKCFHPVWVLKISKKDKNKTEQNKKGETALYKR